MANEKRALALIRRADGSDDRDNLYEAWLYHNPKIRSVRVGVRQTKDLLQYRANISNEFPEQEVLPSDIAGALATSGREVMIYVLTQGVQIGTAREPDIFEEASGVIVQPTAPAEPPTLPFPTRPTIPPLPPLPPLLEPIDDVDPGVKVALASMMDANYQRMLARMFALEEIPSLPSASHYEIMPDNYKNIASHFAALCDYTAQGAALNIDKFK